MIHEPLIQAKRETSETVFLIGPTESYTYARAADTALRLAQVLRRRRWDRLACHATDSPQVSLLLFACSAANCEVCVLNRESSAVEVAELLHRFKLTSLVTDSNLKLDDVEVVGIDALLAEADAADERPRQNTGEPSLLVLTTGTTGPPKAARYVWSDLLAQTRMRPDLAQTRWLLAYHLNHFAGLMVFLHVLVNRATLVIPASSDMSDAIAAIEA
nr:AMP-binding protein [Gemmatimonadaceae bacterium]